jgi:hypothetical protein
MNVLEWKCVRRMKRKREEWDSFFVKVEEDAEHVKDSVDRSCFMTQQRCMTQSIVGFYAFLFVFCLGGQVSLDSFN